MYVHMYSKIRDKNGTIPQMTNNIVFPVLFVFCGKREEFLF